MVRQTSSSQQCLLVVTFGQLVHSCYTSGSGYNPLCHSPTCLDCQRCYTMSNSEEGHMWKGPGSWQLCGRGQEPGCPDRGLIFLADT